MSVATKTSARQRGIVVTDRDLDMFESLSMARYLTAQAIEWLHYPTWQRREAQQEQAGAAQAAPAKSYPSRHLYDRLHRLVDAGLLHRTVRTAPATYRRQRREPDIYTLARAGADLLIDARELDPESVWYEEVRVRSTNMVPHTLAIGIFYAALRAKLARRPDLQLLTWRGDHLLSKKQHHDRIQLGVGNWVGLIPDAMFKLRTQNGDEMLYFVEIDRNRHVDTWRDKVRAYETYRGSRELRARYGVESFSLLTATLTTRQRQRLMEATTQELRRKPAGYYFTLVDELQPLRIGSAWSVVRDFTTASRSLAGKEYTDYQITVADHTLLR